MPITFCLSKYFSLRPHSSAAASEFQLYLLAAESHHGTDNCWVMISTPTRGTDTAPSLPLTYWFSWNFRVFRGLCLYIKFGWRWQTLKVTGGEETGRQHNALSLFSMQNQTNIILPLQHGRQLSVRKLPSVTIGSDIKPIKFKEVCIIEQCLTIIPLPRKPWTD